MRHSYFLLLFAALFITGKASAQLLQPCASDEVRKRMIAKNPDLLQVEAAYEMQINAALKNINFDRVTRTTSTDESGNVTFWYDIPVVVHIIHDYNENQEYLSDNYIFQSVKDWNTVYAKQNSDTSEIIAPFKKWAGNPHIRLHLATIDPDGNPTKGITRRRSYLTYLGGDQAKFDDWAPASYVNIWSINQMSPANGFAAAYAYWPSEAASIPFWDGIIVLSSYVNYGGATGYKTINHEMGHVFSLYHPWGSTNDPAVACGDDLVDDTPPTMGHAEPGCRYDLPSSNQNSTYDSACARNYYKMYTDINGHDSLVNYPDTTNAQNIMDYTYCSKMFTIGQVARMHAALNSNLAGRSNLWDSTNLVMTGVKDASNNFVAIPDLKPIPAFAAVTSGLPSSTNYMNKVDYFTFPHTNVIFHNETWNDTLIGLTWNFSNGATIPTSASGAPISNNIITNSFSQPGWVDLKIIATGNNTGTDTAEWQNAIFVADSVGVNAETYIQNWQPTDDYLKWPNFNYYDNEFHWQLDTTVGFDDHYCMKYISFDRRLDPINYIYPVTGSPLGDFDDLFSVPVDLSSLGDTANLDFYYACASRSSNVADINDTLEIDYTVNKGASWQKLVILSRGSLVNNGAFATEFTPSGSIDWSPKTIGIPAAARTAYTTFRFRYWPHPGSDGIYSSGNDFYLDRINFSRSPAGVENVKLAGIDVAIVPNPTSGDAYVVVKDANNATARVVVTDITGKVVYTTSRQITGNDAQILIPRAAISVSGMYLVQTTTGNQSQTKKLVVY